MTDIADAPKSAQPKTVPCKHCGRAIVNAPSESWKHLETNDAGCALYAEPEQGGVICKMSMEAE